MASRRFAIASGIDSLWVVVPVSGLKAMKPPSSAGMSAGSSQARPDLYVPNGVPKCLWMKELHPNAKTLLSASPIAPEHAQAVVNVTSGKMPLSAPHRQSLAEAPIRTGTVAACFYGQIWGPCSAQSAALDIR